MIFELSHIINILKDLWRGIPLFKKFQNGATKLCQDFLKKNKWPKMEGIVGGTPIVNFKQTPIIKI